MRLSNLAIFVVGLLLGAVLLGLVRFVGQPPVESVHYHANWAIFVDGQRLDLTAQRYMEDVAQCMADPSQQRPQDRVHMHNGDDTIVHVHDAAATWEHLLSNLGVSVGDDFLYTADARWVADGERTLKFVLDGEQVRSIQNLPIGDQDRLLISYGPEAVEDVIATQFPEVESTAEVYNTMPDPASCAGEVEETTGDRLRRAFWF